MNVASSDPAGSPLPGNVRALIRADDDYLIRRIDLVCGKLMDGDYLRAFILNAINVLNVRHITRGGDATRYSALFDFPPDSERIPVSIRHLADVTRLPYETVRRQAHRLVDDGICVHVPGRGIVTPTKTVQRSDYIEVSRAAMAAVTRLLSELDRAGFAFAGLGPAPPAGAKDFTAIARAYLRLDADYAADVIELIRAPHHDDPVEAVVFTSVTTANARHFAPTDYASVDTVAPDPVRRPVSAHGAAVALNIPYETVRRMFTRMAKSGRLERHRQGYIVPAAVELAMMDEACLRRRYDRLVRFLADLQHIGMPMPGTG